MPEEDAEQLASFQGQPDLLARMGRGEWVGLQLGQPVVPNYNPRTHVAPRPLEVVPHAETWMGWDSGGGAHHHCTIVAQQVGRQQIHILACLMSSDTGLEQHLQHTVVPWARKRMPWLLTPAGRDRLFHRMDPSMDPHEGGDAAFNGIRRVREALGGHFHHAKCSNEWGQIIGPILELFNRGNDRGGMAVQIDPGPDCLLLQRTLEGGAYYAMTQNGTMARDKQFKVNHPFEDALDALGYTLSGLAPQLGRDRAAEQAKYQTQRYAKTSGPFDRGDRTTVRRALGSIGDL